MTNETPIDELIFWKSCIDDQQEAGELVPEKMYDLLNHAEKKTLFYLMDKYEMNGLHEEILH